MKPKLIIAALALCCVLSSCRYSDQYDGMTLVDPNTGKQYLLEHNARDNYFIRENIMVISGSDTTWAFR
jgi:hypothetical protein